MHMPVCPYFFSSLLFPLSAYIIYVDAGELSTFSLYGVKYWGKFKTEQKEKETLPKDPVYKEQRYHITSGWVLEIDSFGIWFIYSSIQQHTPKININLLMAIHKALCQERWFSVFILEISPTSHSNTLYRPGYGNFVFAKPFHKQGQEY